MSIEHWLAFCAASAVLLAIPGPTVLMIISHALGHGRRSANATVAGVTLGDFTAMTASMLGSARCWPHRPRCLCCSNGSARPI